MQICKYFSKIMNLSQSYNEGNHLPHNTDKSVFDYPIDETYGDSTANGEFLAPFDCEIVKKWKADSNQVWITSLDKVLTSSGEYFVTIFIGHIKLSEYNNLKVGQKFAQGKAICHEYDDKLAWGNHNHISAGLGKIKGTGWKKNSNGMWCLQTTQGVQKPEKIFYVNNVTIKNGKHLVWKKYDNVEPTPNPSENFFPSKGWFGLGDKHENIGKIATFMRKTFPAYTSEKALGNYYGKYIQASIKEFQKRTGLEADGNIGPLTLKKLKEYGFKD